MKAHSLSVLLTVCAVALSATPSYAKEAAAFKKGDKVQTLANLHPDMNKHILYTLNYQLPGLIPVCSDVTIVKFGGKQLSFDYQGQVFVLAYEGFSKKAGVSFQQAAQNYLGPSCDKAKLSKLGKVDQEGIRTGKALEGMTRDGVLLAMGRPPIHVNPDLNAPMWTYWRNRYVRMEVSFGANGKLSGVK